MILIETYIAPYLTHLIKACWYMEVPANLPQPYQDSATGITRLSDVTKEIPFLQCLRYSGRR
jgi:hypothetical protein